VRDTILTEVKDDRLKAYLVWLPVLEADNRDAAVASAKSFDDPRLTHFWDGDKSLGDRFGKTLELPERDGKKLTFAWDAYLLFGPDCAWKEKELPKPTLWMHQLAPEHPGRLDAKKLRQAVEDALAARKE